MSFSKYQWELYLKAGGQKVVDKFRKFMDEEFDGYANFVADLVSKFSPDPNVIEWNRQTAQDAIEILIEAKAEIKENNEGLDILDDQVDDAEMMPQAEYCSDLWHDLTEELDIQKGK